MNINVPICDHGNYLMQPQTECSLDYRIYSADYAARREGLIVLDNGRFSGMFLSTRD